MEEVIRGEHSVVTGLKQNHILSVVGQLKASETADLLTMCYKLQNRDLMRGYELILERVQEKRSLFHSARDLEMRRQWELARMSYEQLLFQSGDGSDDGALIEEANSNYHHCLQCGGNWKEVRYVRLKPSASFAQSLRLLNWKIESAWRCCDWGECSRFVRDVEWLVKNSHNKWNVKRSEKLLFGEGIGDIDYGFEYYLGKVLLAIKENKNDVKKVIEEGRLMAVKNLAARATSSLYTVYELLLSLQILQDAEWEWEVKTGTSSRGVNDASLRDLLHDRLDAMMNGFENREKLLAVHRVLADANHPHEISALWKEVCESEWGEA